MANEPGRWVIGDVRVTKLMEVPALEIPGTMLLSAATPEAVLEVDWLRPHFATDAGNILFAFQSFLVQTPSIDILIDTCIGNHKPHPVPPINMLDTKFLSALAGMGAPAESIDVVLCTHLHFDHVGWNTRLSNGRWIPTFSNARYLFGREEWQHARAHEPHEGALNDHIAQSVQPIFDAGLVDLVETSHRVCEEIRLIPTPGHTPGHVSVVIESRGSSAVITGDVFHHPIQCAHPDMGSIFCFDVERANASRVAFLRSVAGTDTLVIGSHFAGPAGGLVVADGAGFRLVQA
ncbi:MAG: MBL fold metallo-hydrolase [Steroidobacteraceae bacterium]